MVFAQAEQWVKCCYGSLNRCKLTLACCFPPTQEQEDTPTASLLNLEPTENIMEVWCFFFFSFFFVFDSIHLCVKSKSCCSFSDRRRCRSVSPPAVWSVGQSGDTEEDQGLAVWSGQWRGDRKPLSPPAQRDTRQELCQLLRLLREVGAAGASASTLQRKWAEQEIQ